jgi:MFS family permease
MLEPDRGPAVSTGALVRADTRAIVIGDGVGGLLADRAFRGIAIANVLSAIAFGTSRFVFVWLVGELTEWNTATAILGIVIGMPPLLLSAWAGSLADRLAPRGLGLVLFAVTAVLFGATALLVGSDLMTVPLAMACGFVTAIAPSMLMPLLQALVPAVVPPSRLMQAVAIQNLGMMVSVIFGTFLGGAVIQLLGTAAGFWLLSAASAIGALVYARAPLPDRMAGAGTQRHGAIRDGIRTALGTEPLRSLLAMMGVLGLAITASALLLPELARDVLGQESLAASALNAFMSVGMVVTSMVLATRWTPSRPGFVLVMMTGTTLGGGLVAIGLSTTYALTALVALVWGMCGGIVMTLLRTLMQLNTPPELMGRVMGLSAMAQNGAFPIGSIVLAGLVAATSVSGAMVISGVLCSALIWLVALPPHVRRL